MFFTRLPRVTRSLLSIEEEIRSDNAKLTTIIIYNREEFSQREERVKDKSKAA